jgi:hypothetical protein
MRLIIIEKLRGKSVHKEPGLFFFYAKAKRYHYQKYPPFIFILLLLKC